MLDQSAEGHLEAGLESVFEGRNVGLGIANPMKFAGLQPGEVVLELGSGGGIECFVAAREVGEHGRVIGVEVEPELVAHARAAGRRADARNVEFRLGEPDHLPVADRSVDVVIANCVVDLSCDQEAVFREVYRVLRPGGRLAFSDVVATSPILSAPEDRVAAHAARLERVAPADDVRLWLQAAGFVGVRVVVDLVVQSLIRGRDPGTVRRVASASVEAEKPMDDWRAA